MKFIRSLKSRIKAYFSNFIEITYPAECQSTNVILTGSLRSDTLSLDNLHISKVNFSKLYEELH